MKLVENILHKLNTLERIIVKLFDLDPPPLLMMEETIASLEKVLNKLPEWCTGSWVGQWREKLAMYRAKFNDVLMPPRPPPSVDDNDDNQSVVSSTMFVGDDEDATDDNGHENSFDSSQGSIVSR